MSSDCKGRTQTACPKTALLSVFATIVFLASIDVTPSYSRKRQLSVQKMNVFVLDPRSTVLKSEIASSRSQGLTSMLESPDHVCLSKSSRAVVHDKSPKRRQMYSSHIHGEPFTDQYRKPRCVTLQDGHLVIRKGPRNQIKISHLSVWSEKENIVLEGEGFLTPDRNTQYEQIHELNGDYFTYFNAGGWYGHAGHFKHDVLPKIAYYRSSLPPTIRFLLQDVGVVRETIEFLDPDFAANRVYWIPHRIKPQLIHVVSGTLTVPVDHHFFPFTAYHDLYNPLRQWLKETHPGVPARRTVIYYKRVRGKGKRLYEAKNNRILDLTQEAEVIRRIHNAMIRHNRDYDLVIFDGSRIDPLTKQRRLVTVSEQFALFRSAQTIIGPHGTGLGANLVWIDPAPRDCVNRVQLLEIIGRGVNGWSGVERGDLYLSHYPFVRGLAINYHVLLQLENSKSNEIFIDLDMIDEFLDDVWGDMSGSGIRPESGV